MRRKKTKEITVSIGCVLRNGTVLMVKRREKEQPDIDLSWELPGGKVEKGEIPSYTAIREILEETGYAVYVSDHAPYTYTTYWEYEEFFLTANLICYECRILDGTSRVATEDPKVKEVEWWKIDHIDFSRVLAGSREFIWWVAEKNSYKLTARQTDVLSAYVRFECIDFRLNHKKYYNITIRITKEDVPVYETTRSWGRIEHPSRGNIHEVFRTESEMRKYLLPVLEKRISRGYLIRDFSDDFPFKSWLDKRSSKIDASQLKLF